MKWIFNSLRVCDLKIFKPISTYQPINLSTYQPINLSTNNNGLIWITSVLIAGIVCFFYFRSFKN